MPKGEYLQYGGQAIVEGVMMRSPRYFAVACRAPNGEIILHSEALEKTWIGRQKWLKLPFLRGSLALLDAMALGIRAMRFASRIQLDPIYQPEGAEKKVEAKPEKPRGQRLIESIVWMMAMALFAAAPFSRLILHTATVPRWDFSNPVGKIVEFIGVIGVLMAAAEVFRAVQPTKPDSPASTKNSDRIQEGAIGATMLFSLAFGFGLFVYVPNVIAEYGERAIGSQSSIQINLVSEIVKIVMFLGYIAIIGQFNDVKEVFKYHGAEHKAINTLEADQALDLANCKLQTRLHPRCGTSFAIIVLLLGLVVFTFVPRYPVTGHQGAAPMTDITVRVLLQLVILPFIAGAAYELLRIAGKFRNETFVNLLFKPGIWSQYLTTREPDPPQIEVALTALKAVIDAEESHEQTGTVETNALESTPTVVIGP